MAYQSRNAREGKFQTRRAGMAIRGVIPVGPYSADQGRNRKARKRVARWYPGIFNARLPSRKESAVLEGCGHLGDVPAHEWSRTW